MLEWTRAECKGTQAPISSFVVNCIILYQVEISCGTESALLSVSEPAKCEYHFTATTPALCWPDVELEEVGKIREDL